MNALSISSMKCPNHKCNSYAFVKHGYYSRLVRFERAITALKVRRIKCKNCGHTHGLLPSFLVPYSQITLFDQLYVLHCFLDSTPKFSSDFINSNLDYLDIKRVISNFNRHWKERLNTLNKTLFDPLTHLCNQLFKHQFMQIRRLKFYTFLEST